MCIVIILVFIVQMQRKSVSEVSILLSKFYYQLMHKKIIHIVVQSCSVLLFML